MAEAIAKEAPNARLVIDESIAAMTSLRIGGGADIFVEPTNSIDAASIIKIAGEDLFVIGGGTNLLVSDAGIEGVVMRLGSLDAMDVLEDTADSVALKVGAGLPMYRLLGYTRKAGFAGIGGLSGIPGYLGGAIAGNAGSFGFEIMDVVESVTIVSKDGNIVEVARADISPAYRDGGVGEMGVIIEAALRLQKESPAMVALGMDEALKKKNETQPLGAHTAGCVFKNPSNDSAGRLIDSAGCKGMNRGGVEVSRVHAGFFINTGGATAGDFLALMADVRARVEDSFGVTLYPEIKVVGRDA